MEIFIGIRDNTRQLGLDVDMTESELMAKVHEALAATNGVLDLTDTKGQRTLVPPRPSHTCRSPTSPNAASASRSTKTRPDKRGRGNPSGHHTARGTPASSRTCRTHAFK